MMITVDLVDDLSGDAYRSLLRWCAARSARVMLVLRRQVRLTARAESVLKAIEQHRLSAVESCEWPGTMLLDDTATVITYDSTPAVIDVLSSSCDRLYGWLHPDLPEDLCFIRKDGLPLLVTIAHERDGYLELTAAELVGLRRSLPDLPCVVRRNDSDASS